MLCSRGHDNTAVGVLALGFATGSGNIAIGSNAGVYLTTSHNNIDISNGGLTGESNTIRIGQEGTHEATFIAAISGVAVAGTQVVIDSSGQLGVAPSSARFKEEIKPMDKASTAILALTPVTFRYIQQFGLIAEQVEEVNPDLVARDEDGKAYTVRYEAVNAMLLNEFLKEHRKVQELEAIAAKQEATAANQQKEIKALAASLKQQASQIQKVSAALEVIKPAPQTVLNNQ